MWPVPSCAATRRPPWFPSWPSSSRRWARWPTGWLGKIVSALSDHDAVLAAQLDRDDDAMDHLYQRLFAVLLSPDWPMGVEAAIDGALLGRYYERYADNAVNVGHHVVALITGKTD
nr:hypothetical protein GCM10020092_077450 [Actinoplanes digitatis]